MNAWSWLLPVAVYIFGLLALVALVPWMSRRADRWMEREVARALDGCYYTDDPCLPDVFADIANRTRIDVDPRLPDLYLIPNHEEN